MGRVQATDRVNLVDGVEREPANGTDVGVLPCKSEAPSAWDVMACNIAGNRGAELM